MALKVTSITFIDADKIPRIAHRETETAKAVATILENLARVPVGKGLIIDAEGFKKATRYTLQKNLQKKNQKVVVTNGTNPANNRPCMFVRILTDKEWREWLTEGASVGQPKKK